MGCDPALKQPREEFAMNAFTAIEPSVQPFAVLIKRAVVTLIDAADDPLDREHRIQVALEEGAISYAEAYALRCGDDL